MTPEHQKSVGFYKALPKAEGLLRPDQDFHWSRIFQWNRGECFRIATPIHAATYGDRWSKDFSKIYGTALVMPLTLMTKGLGFGARAIKEKKFTTHTLHAPAFYSAGTCFQRPFKYGTPIMVVEGVLDAEVASLTYPWVVASLTARLSEPQAFLLSHLTNTVVLSLDADEAGERGAHFSAKYLRKWGVQSTVLQPAGVKDWGDLLSKPPNEMQDELNRVVMTLRTKGIESG